MLLRLFGTEGKLRYHQRLSPDIEQSWDDEVVDWFELHITVVVGNLRIPVSRFRKHILEEKREYLLPDGRMILLPEEWFSKYANLLEDVYKRQHRSTKIQQTR